MSKEILELARLATVGAAHQSISQKVVDDLTAAALQTDDTLLNTKQAAKFTNLSVWSLQTYRARGVGPAYFRDDRGRIRYSIGDLKAYLRRKRVSPAGPTAD
jgi:hypothetical protein